MLAAFAAGAGEPDARPKMLLNRALRLADGSRGGAARPSRLDQVEAGSARRLADSVKDLDIIATATDPPALLRAFAELDVVESSSSPGTTPGGRGQRSRSVDLRVVEPDQFGNLLQHFTGSRPTTWRCARRRCAAAVSPSMG